jgi:hypothetical protein
VDSTKIESHLNPVTDKELAELEQQMKNVAFLAQNYGFQQVIISAIPNKATASNNFEGKSNRLLLNLEANPAIQSVYVGVMNEFMDRAHEFYQIGDTHWNCKGRDLWLAKIKSRIAAKN